ncbi:MAG TPA: hypothetical protein VFG10_15135 [Saprospiraceae bacterium]|nr:hypothetical protein [Saprospiraceae bacterium]
MGYSLNTKAYELFIQLEVGLREFLIVSIRTIGVFEWTNKFLGTVQRENIGDVVKRIEEAYKIKKNPEIEDQYIYKLNRAKKDNVFLSVNLFHPFYYLNWNDIESLFGMKYNIALIDKQIGRLNRETIIDTLKPLTHLRNDIAHSRFISEDNYKFIKSSFDKISVLIPNFEKLINFQSLEQNTSVVLHNLNLVISKIINGGVLQVVEIEEMQYCLNNCENSFWINTENNELIKLVKDLNTKLILYRKFRDKPGGLLEIHNMKPLLTEIANKIKNITNE